MFGFSIVQGCKTDLKCKDQIVYKNIICQNQMIDKFVDDKLFFETKDYIIIIDGVILNKQLLMQQYGISTWKETVLHLLNTNGDTFFSILRGSFAGAVYKKIENSWILFTDQLGSKFLYYYYQDNIFICSSMIDNIYHILSCNNILYHLDSYSSLLLLTYGFMLEDKTLCTEIRKITPGSFGTLNNGNVKINCYYKLSNKTNNSISEQEAIEQIEILFTKACKNEFSKDTEYGYKHAVALSGGLDCRMTSFVGDKLGYKQQVNFTFSQSGYLDQVIASQISSYLKHEWVYKTLDNGIWLFDVEKAVRMTGGNVAYTTIAHTNSMYSYVNFEELGLLHSGQLGDVIIATHGNIHERPSKSDGAFAPRHVLEYDFNEYHNYPNKEMFLYYNRYLNGTNNGLQNVYNYTETLSPFLDLELIEYCLSLPDKLRKDHYIYHKWILAKHPDASNFVWEKTGNKINNPHFYIGNRVFYINNFVPRILNKIFKRKGGVDTLKHMNPFGYYIETNKELKDYLYAYYQYIDKIDSYDVRKLCKIMIQEGTAQERLQVVTLCCAIKLYFYENKL